MIHTSELRENLAHFFNWNKSRLTCLANIVQALFCVRTINLTQIAVAFHTDCKVESAYRRICRFFTDFSFDVSSITSFIFNMFPLKNQCVLILDRTNWKWGKTPINILMLSIAYKGISIPFFWSVLDLEGSSCTDDRIRLIQRTLEKFPANKIEVLLADREFVGTDWMHFLIKANICFLIRAKKSYKITELDHDRSISIYQILKNSGRKKKVKNIPVEMWGLQLYLSFWKSKRGAKEPMILISNDAFEDPFSLYKKRWGIETLFGCLKSRGFRMEDTHVTNPEKIEKILFVLAIVFCWAYKIGEIKMKETPIPQKAHGRPSKSVFRLGLDLIRRVSMNNEQNVERRRQPDPLLNCLNGGGYHL